MRLKNSCLVLLLAFFTAVAPLAAEVPTIRVGSFMLNGFGSDPEAAYERSLLSLAHIASEMQADAIALQGVSDSDFGRAQVDRFARLLTDVGASSETPAYQVVATSFPDRRELAVFLVRAPVKVIGEPVLAPLGADRTDGRKLFKYQPAVVRLQAGDFVFDFANIHLHDAAVPTGSHAGRAAELAALAGWVREREVSGEQPLIIAGVTNRHLRRNVWNALQHPGHEAWFRLPLMEAAAHEFPGFSAIDDQAPSAAYNTVTNPNRRRFWDNIIVSRGAFDRIAATPRLGTDVGLVPFDLRPEYLWVTSRHAATVRMLTDHRPLWLELRLTTQ